MTHRSSPAASDRPAGEPVTLAALLTPPGRGALAVIGLSGPAAAAIVATLFRSRRGGDARDWSAGRIGVGLWRGAPVVAADIAAEEVVLLRGDDHWEVHCHGGTAAPAAILADVAARGAEVVAPAQWLARSRVGTAGEALAHVAGVGGAKGAAILCRQAAGALDSALDELARLSAGGERVAAASLAERLRRAARVGLRLADPWRVVVVGPVNAGKSSLVNALVGHARSIVSPQPGTTRDLVESRVVLDGWETILVDTAGLREEDIPGPTEREGIARAVAAADAADLVIRVMDGDAVPVDDGGITVWSKADLRVAVDPPPGVIAVSTVTGAGIERLAAAIVGHLVPEAAEPGLLDGPVPFMPHHLELVAVAAGWDAGPTRQ